MKFKRLTESRINYEDKPYYTLTEANLNRIVKGHDKDGYAIISPCRDKGNLEVELNTELTDQQAVDMNNTRVKDMKSKLKSMGYSYVPVLGGYKEEGSMNFSYEKSFVVYPFDQTKEGEPIAFDKFSADMIALGKEFNQDSVLIKAPDEKAKYVDQNGDTVMEFDGVTLNDISKEYFTALKNYNVDHKVGKPQRFSFESLYFNKPSSIMNSHTRFSCNEMVYPPNRDPLNDD